MFKNLTNLASAMKNMGQIGAQLKSMNARLEVARVYGSASSGAHTVNVELSGLGVVQSISVSDGLMSPDQKSLLQDLTRDAMNHAVKSAKEMHINEVKELTGGAEFFPGMNDMMQNMIK
jgi:DNA-binding YbaB/EbfC family protein